MSERDENLVTLGQQIRAERLKTGWSQEEFAHQCGIDRSYMGGIERGERNISFTKLCLIAETLQVGVAELTSSLPVSGKSRE